MSIKGISLLFLISLLTLEQGGFCGPSARTDRIAEWKIGDTWTVRTWYPKVTKEATKAKKEKKHQSEKQVEAVDVVFKVSDFVFLNGHQCFRLELVFPEEETGFQSRYNLYFTKEERVLICVIDVSKRTNGSLKNIRYEYGFETNAPVITSSIMSPIPFDFPAFSSMEKVSRHTFRGQEIRQEITDESDKETSLVKLMANIDGKERTVLQEWNWHLPWWRKCKIVVNGTTICEAELVEGENRNTNGR